MQLSQPNPATYPKDLMPPRYRLHALRTGDIVKLHTKTGSAIWARIIEHNRVEKLFTAEIEDTVADDFKRGDRLTFGRCNVFEVV